MSIKFRDEITNIIPYKPGRPIDDVKKEYGLADVVKLASNENPLGCSEKVKEAIIGSLDELSRYPDGSSLKLKNALAEKYGLDPDQILPSNGLDEMIDLVSKAFLDKDDEILVGQITFPRYSQTAEIMGARTVMVPFKDYSFDLEKTLASITDKTKIIWICNPNNPTGTMISEEEFVSFLSRVPSNIMVVSDEAYREFVTKDTYPHETTKLLPKYPNLLIMRTFSKAYGLAGIRVAYTIGSSYIIEAINKVRGPFNVNLIAQAAAIAGLEDVDFLKKSYEVNLEGKEYIYSEFDKMGIEYVPSETNHIFFFTKENAEEIFIELQKKGVIIRPQGGKNLRVSIGTMEENRVFIEKLKEVLK